VDDLVARARVLLRTRRRAVLGLCGPPAAGKSSLADALVRGLGAEAVVVPLDGFHLHDAELARLGRLARKGAPDTFDVDGYVALLRRINADPDRVVYAPAFDRDHELSLAGAIPVLPEHRLVVTEGNYLLLDRPGWSDVRPELAECWYLVGDDDARRRRLVGRHVGHGRTPAAAEAWVASTDDPNARLVESTRDAADLAVEAAAWMTG
jgi:pantothenate kinase